MQPPLLERWTTALSTAESAIAAAVKARIFSSRDATEARRTLEDHVRWLAGRSGR
jgi:hypothetical protein